MNHIPFKSYSFGVSGSQYTSNPGFYGIDAPQASCDTGKLVFDFPQKLCFSCIFVGIGCGRCFLPTIELT